jgi:hypothetical protein
MGIVPLGKGKIFMLPLIYYYCVILKLIICPLHLRVYRVVRKIKNGRDYFA